jgi:hypothetical protein
MAVGTGKGMAVLHAVLQLLGQWPPSQQQLPPRLGRALSKLTTMSSHEVLWGQ